MSQHSITRVELHGATTNAQYDGLHKAMEAKGFSRTVPAADKSNKRLPTATYYMEVRDDVTALSLTNFVVGVVEFYWPKPRSFETLSTIGPVAWHNLPKV